MELYLDQLHDLLYSPETVSSDKPRLELREDPNTGMININNVQTCALTTIEDATEVYQFGVQQRKTAQTAMN